MTDDELVNAVKQAKSTALGAQSGRLSEMRRKALQYYLGRPVGDLAPPAIAGRSKAMDTSVMDTIEWMMPSIMRIFVSGDRVVEFTPQQPGQEESARDATDYIEYLLMRRNPGYWILNNWFKDALLQKVGILKVYWDNHEEFAKEEYKGLTEVDLAELLDDEEVEVKSQKKYDDPDAVKQKAEALEHYQQQYVQMSQDPRALQPQQPGQPAPIAMLLQQISQVEAAPIPQLYDVVCQRTKAISQACVENIPPEEFWISSEARSIAESQACGHDFRRSLSYLRARGYSGIDELAMQSSADTSDDAFTPEATERQYLNDDALGSNSNNYDNDESQRMVWVTEAYMQLDMDGDGIAEWRKLTIAGNTLLDNEEADRPPFVSICPIPIPHQFFGLCPADQAIESQEQKTATLRTIIDNHRMNVDQRYVVVNGKVNLDDMLNSRPGGIIRATEQGAVMPLNSAGANMNESYQLMELLESQKENRTGWTRMSNGLNPDALHKTASGTENLTSRGDQRIELIARNFAETGFRELFIRLLELVCKHQREPGQMKVAGNWVQVNPREWRQGFDLQVNVGLGSGNKDQQLAQIQQLMQFQMAGLQLGVATPQNIYHSGSKLVAALGFKGEENYISDPSKAPPKPPPPPDPAVIKAQLDAQGKQQQLQMQSALKEKELQMQAQVDAIRFKAEAERDASKEASQAQAAMVEAQYKAQIEAIQHDADRQAAAEAQALDIQAKIEIALIQAQSSGQESQDSAALALQLESIRQQTAILVASMKPKEPAPTAPKTKA